MTGCSTTNSAPSHKSDVSNPEKLVVYASFYPLAFFAQEIGGDKVEVHTITPVGAEPHDYEPTQKEMVQINQADLLVYNGAGLEGWVEKIKNNVDPQKTRVIETTKNLDLHSTKEEKSDHHQHEEDHEHEIDPHVWLDPQLAKKQAENIKNALVQKDPKHKSMYENNFDQLAKRFDQLDQSYKTELSQLKKRDVITSHAAYGYLTARYGLNQVAISGLSTDQQPSPKKLKEIIQLARQKHISYIFFEKLVQPKVASIVTDEIHAIPLVLDPLEGLTSEEIKKGEDYFTISMRNLQNLKTALK
jgi:zinc transport system substrate-binding protein